MLYRITLMCRTLSVSKAGYYAWRSRESSARARADAELGERIGAYHRASRGRYESPRLHADLIEDGIRCRRKRIARLMRVLGLKGLTRRRYRRAIAAAYDEQIAPNRLGRCFRVAAPNTVWAADFTHIPTSEGALYLAVIIDLYSRRVVGWAMRSNPDRELVLPALEMALLQWRPTAGLVHHSDRGTQYTSAAFQRALTNAGIISSMSRKGDCWDNAVVESFFASFKREIADDRRWNRRDDARAAIFEYLETWYNRQRRHSSLGYLSPEAFEAGAA